MLAVISSQDVSMYNVLLGTYSMYVGTYVAIYGGILIKIIHYNYMGMGNSSR